MSVRTLRFYDQVGLLVPTGRTEAGYRLYSSADLVRLQQIQALKFLGFALDEIKRFLKAPPLSLRAALAQQRAMLSDRRSQLEVVLRAVAEAEQVVTEGGGTWDALVAVIQALQMNQRNDWRTKHLTEEQLTAIQAMVETAYSPEAKAALAARPAWTEADQQRVDAQYAALYTGVRQAVAANEEPGGAAGQVLAGQAIGLIEAFTGNNPAVAEGLHAFWASHNTLPAEQRPVQVPLSEAEASFLEQAKAIFTERRAASTG